MGFISRYAEGGDWHLSSVISSNNVNIPELMFGGGRNLFGFVFKKGGKPFNRLAPTTRNGFFMEGGAGCLVCAPFHYEGGVC